MIHTLSVWLSKRLLLSEGDPQDIKFVKVTYSIECLLGELFKFLGALVIFGFFHQTYRFLICYTTTILIRPFLGGLHMKTMFGCFVFSVIVFSAVIMCESIVEIPYFICLAELVVEALVIYKFAPIPSKERPRYTVDQKCKIRHNGLIGELLCIVLMSLFTETRNIIIWMMIFQQLEVYISIYILGRREGRNNEI